MKRSIKALLALSLAFGAASAQAGVIATDSSYGLFDGFGGKRQLNVGTHGAIADLNILISFAKCDNPVLGVAGGPCVGTGTPYENEIVLRLVSPGGVAVDLVKQDTFEQGGSGIGQVSVNFDDEGEALGPRVQPGTFKPVGTLSVFDTLDAFGTWTLQLGDTKLADPLEYYHSQLVIRFVGEDAADPGAVPEPASFGLLALGLGGLLAARRRPR